MEKENFKLENDLMFDLYTNMKINIKCSSPNCEIHDSEFTHFCLQCKRPVCEICKESFHTNHPIQSKKYITFSVDNINNIFTQLENQLNSSRILVNSEDYKRELKDRISREFEEIEDLIQGLKRRKLSEIDTVFSEVKSSKPLSKNVKDTKKEIIDYFNKFNEIFNSKDVKDEDHAIFLQTYDLYNSVSNTVNNYCGMINIIKEYYESYEKNSDCKYQGIRREIEKSLEEEKKAEIFTSNMSMFELLNTNNNIIQSGSSDLNVFKMQSNEAIKERLSPKDAFKKKVSTQFEKLNEDMFKDIKDKMTKTAEFIEIFKRTTFESFKKHGSLIDIEKAVKLFDEKTNKRTNFIKGKANLKFSPSQAKAYSVSGVIPNGDISKISMNKSANNQDQTVEVSSGNKVRRDSFGKHMQAPQSFLKDKNKENGSAKSHETSLSPSKDMKSFSEINNLESLKEEVETDSDNGCKEENKESESSLNETENDMDNESNEGDLINLENGFGTEKKLTLSEKKLLKMFKPMKKKTKTVTKLRTERKNKEGTEENKYKVNSKLQEIIKENQKLCTMIKRKEDINLSVTTLRRYYSYLFLEFVRKTFFKTNQGCSLNLLEDSNQKDELIIKDSIRVFEGTCDIQIYCRNKRKLIKNTITLEKKVHGISVFPSGARLFYTKDRVYITGGKDCNQEYKLFLMYSIKENRIYRLPDLVHARSYHTMVYHENLKNLLVFGGENNKTCEMFDFFLNTWNEIPDLNLPRANISIYIDKIGTFAYAFCGTTGSIANGHHCDAIELLDLVDMNQGWARVDYQNKANVDLKFSHTGVYPLTDDKLLIYGASDSRRMQKCFVIFNLRTFDVTKIDKELLENLRLNAIKNPELSKIFL